MKLLAIILLSYFSTLLVAPASFCHGNCCQTEKTCKASCCHKEAKPVKPLTNKSTAPFCCPFCNCCFGFIPSNNNLVLTATNKPLRVPDSYIQPITANFICDCWRPPESSVCLLG